MNRPRVDRPVVENPAFAQAVRRMLRALARRAGGDVETLPILRDMQDDLDALMRQAVTACRAENYSWAEIAKRLGTTRQAAQQRYGSPTSACSIECQDSLDSTARRAIGRAS